MELEVRVARPDDLGDVLGVLDEAAAWLLSIGMARQWPASFSDDAQHVEQTRRFIDAESFYAGVVDGAIAGCFRLEQRSPEAGAWPSDAAVTYLYSLAVRRRVAGSGIALCMLDCACEVARARGSPELRLDCWAGNTKLRRFYSDAGFEWRGDIEVQPDGKTMTANEENLGASYSVSLFARSLEPKGES